MQQNSQWLTIWTKPRETIRSIINSDPVSKTVLLATTNGIIAAITWLATFWVKYPQDKKFSHPLFTIFVLALGFLGGLINLYFGSFLYRWIGSWIGGKGSYQDVKCAVGWSNYPYIVSGIFGLIAILFTSHPLIQFPFLILKVGILIWGFIIFLKMVGEAHRFSAWKTLAILLIGCALVFIIVFGISLFISYLVTQSTKTTHTIKI